MRQAKHVRAFAGGQADFWRRRHGKHSTGEHLLADKLAPSGVGGTDKFYRPIIRVSPSARSGKHGLREHALTGKLTSNFACGNSRLHHSINRVWALPSARSGKHGLCEHVLADKTASNFACRASSFRIPANRVLPSPRKILFPHEPIIISQWGMGALPP